jgi:elongation factor P
MISATELAQGMVVRVEDQICRVLKVEAKAAAAKLGGVVKAELSNVNTGRLREARFRPQERLEDLEITRRNMEFLFPDADNCTFMDPNSFEQIEVAIAWRLNSAKRR